MIYFIIQVIVLVVLGVIICNDIAYLANND